MKEWFVKQAENVDENIGHLDVKKPNAINPCLSFIRFIFRQDTLKKLLIYSVVDIRFAIFLEGLLSEFYFILRRFIMSFVSENFLKLSSSLILLISLSGCASNTVLSPAEKSAIHTVSVNSKVNMPDSISYSTNTEMGAMIGAGLIGYAIVDGAESGERGRIKSDMQQNGVDINSMLIQNFIEKIPSETNYKLAQSGFGDAQFKLNVNSYGFASAGFSSGAAIPTMSVDARLVDSKGRVLWQNTQKAILDQSPYNSYSIDYYLHNPIVMKKAFQMMTSEVSDNLLDNLQSGN